MVELHLLGGAVTVWLLPKTLDAWLGLPVTDGLGEAVPGGLQATLFAWASTCARFLPGALAGGALGWFEP